MNDTIVSSEDELLMTINSNGCIWKGRREVIDIVTSTVTLSTELEKILVLHKKTPKIIATNTIWDGFWIPLVFERPPIYVDLDTQACASGIVSFVSFDEMTWSSRSYAYKYPKTDVDYLNEMLDAFDVDVRAVLDDAYVALDTDVESIVPQEYTWMLSYIFGLALVYGEFDIVWEDVLTHVSIRFPMRESFISVYDMLLQRRVDLSEMWVFYALQLHDADMGQYVTLDISDTEVLSVFASWLWWNSRQVDSQILQEYVSTNLPHLMSTFSNSVLKFVQK